MVVIVIVVNSIKPRWYPHIPFHFTILTLQWNLLIRVVRNFYRIVSNSIGAIIRAFSSFISPLISIYISNVYNFNDPKLLDYWQCGLDHQPCFPCFHSTRFTYHGFLLIPFTTVIIDSSFLGEVVLYALVISIDLVTIIVLITILGKYLTPHLSRISTHLGPFLMNYCRLQIPPSKLEALVKEL